VFQKKLYAIFLNTWQSKKTITWCTKTQFQNYLLLN